MIIIPLAFFLILGIIAAIVVPRALEDRRKENSTNPGDTPITLPDNPAGPRKSSRGLLITLISILTFLVVVVLIIAVSKGW
jgi:hypothetical protein